MYIYYMQASNIDWILKKHQNSTYNNRDATGDNEFYFIWKKMYILYASK